MAVLAKVVNRQMAREHPRPERRTANEAAGHARRLAWIGYGAMAAGSVLYIISIWLQVYLDTRRATAISVSAFDESHRHWRVRTTLVFLVWSILGGLALPLGIGWLFLVPAYLWYVVRVLRGMISFARGGVMPVP